VRTDDTSLIESAQHWAVRLGCPLLHQRQRSDALVLELRPESPAPGYRLVLRCPAELGGGNVQAEFVTGALGYRLRAGGGRSQPLARAVGLRGGAALEIVDATAGLGRDAFVLASLGCRVTLVERSPIVAALVEDGLRRAAADEDVAEIVARMRLVTGDGRVLLARLAEDNAGPRPDVVYMDPMYPARTKSALVKKELRALRALVGGDEDAGELLAAALHAARRRVVVKRPLRAPPVGQPAPSTQIRGKTTRYDVYLNVG